MAYPSGTILTRSEPKGTEEEPDALDVVEVIGPSPVRNAPHQQWDEKGDLLLVRPHEAFGATEVVPEAILRRDYDVTEYPDEETKKIELDPPTLRRQRARTPEQVFADEAKKSKREREKAADA